METTPGNMQKKWVSTLNGCKHCFPKLHKIAKMMQINGNHFSICSIVKKWIISRYSWAFDFWFSDVKNKTANLPIESINWMRLIDDDSSHLFTCEIGENKYLKMGLQAQLLINGVTRMQLEAESHEWEWITALETMQAPMVAQNPPMQAPQAPPPQAPPPQAPPPQAPPQNLPPFSPLIKLACMLGKCGKQERRFIETMESNEFDNIVAKHKSEFAKLPKVSNPPSSGLCGLCICNKNLFRCIQCTYMCCIGCYMNVCANGNACPQCRKSPYRILNGDEPLRVVRITTST